MLPHIVVNSTTPSEAPKGYQCLSWPFVALFRRLTLSLEEKDLSLRTLEENNLAQMNQASQLRSALNQAEELHSEHRRELEELNTQVSCALASSSLWTHNYLWLGGLSLFPLPVAPTAAVFCPWLLLRLEAKAGSAVCCQCFPPFSSGSQQEMWEKKLQQTPLELLSPCVSRAVPDAVGACARH